MPKRPHEYSYAAIGNENPMAFFMQIRKVINMFIKRKEVNALIMRSEISNMLMQFDFKEKGDNPYSQADIEFVKTVLLPIKAKLTVGLQEINQKDVLRLNEYQLAKADNCIKYLKENNITWAYQNLQDFFGALSNDHIFCGYAELIIGVILINETLLICDSKSSELAETQKRSMNGIGRKFLEDVINGDRHMFSFQNELDFWHNYFPNYSIKEYFGLSCEEYKFYKNSFEKIFNIIVYCRKNCIDIDSYLEETGK